MDKLRFRVVTLMVSCMLLLLGTAREVIAWPCPPCPPCYTCTETGCEWDCGSTGTCCAGTCCSNTCCFDTCCTPGQNCCDDICCSNACCGNTCCDPGETCCEISCCSNACCAGTCCGPGETCCGSQCCLSECCGGLLCCGTIGKNCCDDLVCYDPVTEKCCGDGNGTVCNTNQACCNGTCCPEGEICCDDGSCASPCVDGEPTDDCNTSHDEEHECPGCLMNPLGSCSNYTMREYTGNEVVYCSGGCAGDCVEQDKVHCYTEYDCKAKTFIAFTCFWGAPGGGKLCVAEPMSSCQACEKNADEWEKKYAYPTKCE